jgi:hypothetical protein
MLRKMTPAVMCRPISEVSELFPDIKSTKPTRIDKEATEYVSGTVKKHKNDAEDAASIPRRNALRREILRNRRIA